MPTFTSIALENLLDRDSSPYTKSSDFRRSSNHIYISPALYTTPAPAPIPEVSSEFPLFPSPYVVNHKRRGGLNGGRIAEKREDLDLDLGNGNEMIEDSFEGVGVEIEGNFGADNEISEYLDPVGSSESFRSGNEGGKSIKGGVESHSFVSSQCDFFDAIEDFSSDGSSSSGLRGQYIESEIRAMRVSLLEEIGKRKTAEDTLKLMQNQWQRINNLLAHVGLTLPALPIADDELLEQLAQEVIVTKFVAEAVGKGVARAEAELVTQTIIESKEQEISRLRDKLQYYEAVNLEMSQRNQEIVEVARRQRQKRQRQRKWLWSCIGLTITIGTGVIASSFLPATGNKQQLPSAGDTFDGSMDSETV